MTGSVHRTLAQISSDYFDAYLEAHPTTAAWMGFHAYDGRVPDLRKPALETRAADLRRFLEALDAIDPADLDDRAWLDYQVIRHQAAFEAFMLEDWRRWARDPLVYLDALDVSNYILRSYAPLERRVHSLIDHLMGFPAVCDAMQANLTQVSRPVLRVAVRLAKGTLSFLESDLPRPVAALEDEALQRRFAAANQAAVDTMASLVGWLEDDVGPRADAGFALGADRFARMLRLGEAVDVPLDHLREIAGADLLRNKAAYLDTVAQIAPGRDPHEVAAEGSRNHPDPDQLIEEARRIVEDLRRFVVQSGVVSVPADENCIVAETPSFLRSAFAMMYPPGPFERVAKEAYYHVTPPRASWSEQRTEEWMTRFAYHFLRGICVHEAWPGHYLHFLHRRTAPSKITRAFGAYSFDEAWAHYCEEMMLEIGWCADDPWARMGQLNEALVRNVRFVCALGLHTEGMTVAEATERFVEDAFMEPAPAQEEAQRGTGDPQYLNYTLGKLMLLKLRRDVRTQERANFDLRRFHDRFLSYGAPPVPLVRALMLGRDDQEIL
jgi:uncharacterized protein (DUF885 family)